MELRQFRIQFSSRFREEVFRRDLFCMQGFSLPHITEMNTLGVGFSWAENFIKFQIYPYNLAQGTTAHFDQLPWYYLFK